MSIELGDRKPFLCAIYIPPDRIRDINYVGIHCDSVSWILAAANTIDHIVILGDFNLPGISCEHSPNGFLIPNAGLSVLYAGTTKLLDSYSSATLQQIYFIANENNRYLDLCFTSDEGTSASVTMAPSPLVKLIAHHSLLTVSIDHMLPHDLVFFPVSFFYNYFLNYTVLLLIFSPLSIKRAFWIQKTPIVLREPFPMF